MPKLDVRDVEVARLAAQWAFRVISHNFDQSYENESHLTWSAVIGSIHDRRELIMEDILAAVEDDLRSGRSASASLIPRGQSASATTRALSPRSFGALADQKDRDARKLAAMRGRW